MYHLNICKDSSERPFRPVVVFLGRFFFCLLKKEFNFLNKCYGIQKRKQDGNSLYGIICARVCVGVIEGGINICSCMSNLSLEGYTGNSHDDLGGEKLKG